MRSVAFAASVFLIAAASSPAHAEPDAVGSRKLTIAVLPLRADALQLNEAKRLNFVVRQRAATRGGFDVQSEESTTALLEASQSLGVDCDVNAVDCGTQIGLIADVDRVLVGRATGALAGAPQGEPGTAPVGQGVGLDLRLIDVKNGAELRRVSALLPAEPALQTAAVNDLAELLYGDNPLVALEVVAEPAGAEVIVNGVPRGAAPLAAPVDALAPGTHHVLIRKKGFLPFEGRVAVLRGEAARLEIRLEPDPEGVRTENSPFAVAVPFVIAGGGALLATTGGVLLAFGLDPWFRYTNAKSAIASAKSSDAGYAATVTEQWRIADEAATEWETRGQGMTAAGVALLGVGVTAVVGGAIVGIVLLTSSDDETASAAE